MSIFQYNQASSEQGGAVRAEDNSAVSLSNSQFAHPAYLDGGAVFIDNLLDLVQALNSEFISMKVMPEMAVPYLWAVILISLFKGTYGNAAADRGGAIVYLPTFFFSPKV